MVAQRRNAIAGPDGNANRSPAALRSDAVEDSIGTARAAAVSNRRACPKRIHPHCSFALPQKSRIARPCKVRVALPDHHGCVCHTPGSVGSPRQLKTHHGVQSEHQGRLANGPSSRGADVRTTAAGAVTPAAQNVPPPRGCAQGHLPCGTALRMVQTCTGHSIRKQARR